MPKNHSLDHQLHMAAKAAGDLRRALERVGLDYHGEAMDGLDAVDARIGRHIDENNPPEVE